MTPGIELATNRLCLRQWRDDDYAPFAAMSLDPRVSEYLPPFPDEAACRLFLDRLRSAQADRGWGFWALERKSDGAFIGTAGLHTPGPEFGLPPRGEAYVEIGWRLSPGFWGKGYVTEAAREVLRFAFATLRLPEVVSFTALGNTRSLAVMERLGMTRTPHIFDLLFFAPGHPHRRHCVYAITLGDWQGGQRTATP